MKSKKKTRRDYLCIAAIDPMSGKKNCQVQISYDRIMTVGRRSMGQAKECAELVPLALQMPTAIFEGLCWDDDEDTRGFGWRCYCYVPDRAYNADGSQRDPWPDEVFLVFVNDEAVAYSWRWDGCDPDNPTLPEGHNHSENPRFKRNLI